MGTPAALEAAAAGVAKASGKAAAATIIHLPWPAATASHAAKRPMAAEWPSQDCKTARRIASSLPPSSRVMEDGLGAHDDAASEPAPDSLLEASFSAAGRQLAQGRHGRSPR